MVLTVPISNRTLFSLKTDVVRYSLITWSSLSLITNLVGNSIVLLATFKYKAIKLDKVSVVLIQNIAGSDILMGLNTIFPTLLSLIADKWILGDILCYVQHYMKVPIFLSAELLICAMHLNKLACLTFPLKSIYKNRSTGCILALSMWVVACVIPSVQLYVDKESITFDYRLYRCHYVFRAPVWKWARPLLLSTIMIVPNILVLLSTITLMIFVWRKRGKINLQGAITSVFIGLAYVIAFGPVAVNQSVIINLYPTMTKDTRSFFFVVFSRIAFFTTFLNGMSNVFIYSLSVKSFGDFISKNLKSPIIAKMRNFHRALSFHSLQGQKFSSTQSTVNDTSAHAKSVKRQESVNRKESSNRQVSIRRQMSIRRQVSSASRKEAQPVVQA